MTAVVPAQVAEDFLARARVSGHPVVSGGAGLWPGPEDYPSHVATAAPDAWLAPNDVLDAARETARARAGWVHAVLPTLADAVRLTAAVQPAAGCSAAVLPVHALTEQADHSGGWLRLVRRATSQCLAGDPRREAFADLIAQMPVTARTLTTVQDGRAVHVAEIPAVWLARQPADPCSQPDRSLEVNR